MRIPKRHRLRSLLAVLILLLEPFSAQTLYACAMMGGAMLDNCCCDEHEPFDAAVDELCQPCCDLSVELRIDPESVENSATAKPAKMQSDVDPPPAILLTTVLVNDLNRVVVVAASVANAVPRLSGTRTYLLTRRLRI